MYWQLSKSKLIYPNQLATFINYISFENPTIYLEPIWCLGIFNHLSSKAFIESKAKWAPELKRNPELPQLSQSKHQSHPTNPWQPSSSSEWTTSKRFSPKTQALKSETLARSLETCGRQLTPKTRPSMKILTSCNTPSMQRRRKTTRKVSARSSANRANPPKRLKNQKAGPRSESLIPAHSI